MAIFKRSCQLNTDQALKHLRRPRYPGRSNRSRLPRNCILNISFIIPTLHEAITSTPKSTVFPDPDSRAPYGFSGPENSVSSFDPPVSPVSRLHPLAPRCKAGRRRGGGGGVDPARAIGRYGALPDSPVAKFTTGRGGRGE